MTALKPLTTASLSSVFTARTRAGDMAWAEQALSMGFNAYSELSKDNLWVVCAATHDRKKGAAIALRLVKDVIDRISITPPPGDVAALGLVKDCVTTAIEHGNVAFLEGFVPVFHAMAPTYRTPLLRFLAVGDLIEHPQAFQRAVERVSIRQTRDDKELDKTGNERWAWLSTLSWHDPHAWTTRGPNSLLGPMLESFHSRQQPAGPRLLSMLHNMGIAPSADLIDQIMDDMEVKHGPPRHWAEDGAGVVMVHRAAAMMVLVRAIDMALDAPVVLSSRRSDGALMLNRGQSWADQLQQTGLITLGAALRKVTQRWEGAVLRAETDSLPALARSRSRL